VSFWVLQSSLLACQAQNADPQESSSAQSVSVGSKVTLAYQPGLTYYSFVLMKQQKMLEKQFPNTTIEWKILSGPSPIRDGMIANQIQIGTVGVPTFLVGRDNGVKWKLLSGLIHQEYWLVVNDPAIKSLKDFKPNYKIGVTEPNGIQAVTLRMAARQQLGDPNALDKNLQSLSQPLGLQAFESKQIAAHFTAAPFQWQEVEEFGGQVIVKSSDLFGGLHTGVGVVMMEAFYNQYPAFSQALYTAIQDASRMMSEKPDEAAKILAADSGGKTAPEKVQKWLTNPNVQFNTQPKGYLTYARFLKDTGVIRNQPQALNELVFSTLEGKEGD
jgi:NitT/TauT family transport system substrate-binding protein